MSQGMSLLIIAIGKKKIKIKITREACKSGKATIG
jgi:hypothetical protein